MIETSQSTEKLDAALAKAQASIGAAAKDSRNPHFNSAYADLASIWNACREALTSNGISVTQWPTEGDDKTRLYIVTRLACGGEWIQARWSMPVTKQDPQGFGSAMTYARRYSLAAAVGVAPDDDDDANVASEKPKRQEKTEKRSAHTKLVQRALEVVPDEPREMTPEEIEAWTVEVQLAASISVEKLNELGPDFAKLPDCPAKESLRRLIVKLRSAAAKREAERIAAGKPPTQPESAA